MTVARRAKALVARKLDRPSSVLLELAGLLASAQKQGFALVALDCALEPRRPAGEAAVSVLASFAPFERRGSSQRIRQALALPLNLFGLSN
jgi:DNA invertase Pin-like site-specific DNA recombinase